MYCEWKSLAKAQQYIIDDAVDSTVDGILDFAAQNETIHCHSNWEYLEIVYASIL